jgi:hypothetical protein
LLSLSAAPAIAGGGVVLEDDVCKIKIGFYEAHFTAFQPETSGNRQFCEDLPDVGPTIFVLDYLHDSMKEVPIDFRIIRDVTGLGKFVRLEDVQAIGDIDAQTVYYYPPTIETDGSLAIEPTLTEEGAYIGIVTAGHPTNDEIYSAVFPFEVGRTNLDLIWPFVGLLAFLLPAAAFWYLRNRVRREPQRTA